MEYAKIKRLYSAIFTHANNSPWRPTLSGGYIQAAGQIHRGRKGEKKPANVCWGHSPTALGIHQNSQVLGISINPVSPLMKYRGTQCIY